jgi:hypothetical protein
MFQAIMVFMIFWVIKIDDEGKPCWQKSIGGSGKEWAKLHIAIF